MKKLLSIMLAMVMVLTLSAFTANTDVLAANKKVKSIKVTNAKSKKVSLVKGKTKTLKVKVTVKGKTSKKFTVKSSKKSVVTAKKSGSKKVKLTAKAAGTAKITIKSKANKKKKVVIKVTVTNPPVVKPGTPVTPIVTPETHVAARDYILKETVIPLKAGVHMKDLYLPFMVKNDFTVTKVTGLPNGLKAEKIAPYYMINGKPSETGIFKTSVTVKDNVTGEKNTQDITFVIGNDNDIQAYCPQISAFYMVDGNNTIRNMSEQQLIVVGGSGDFDVSAATGDAKLFSFDDAADGGFYKTYDVSATFNSVGTFKSLAKIKDNINGDIATAELVLAVAQGQKITGKVTDNSGKGVMGLNVVARSTTYYHTLFSLDDDGTDANGNYVLYVAKDSYSISVQKHDLVLAQVDAAAVNKNINLNFKVNGYTINLVSSNSKIDLSRVSWYDGSDELAYYGEGTQLFMPAGTYSIYGTYNNYEDDITKNFVAKATFTVSGNKSVTVNVETKQLPINAGVISGTSHLVNIDSNLVFYRFTPVQSGNYVIKSSSPEGKDIEAFLYDTNGRFLTSDSDGNNTYGESNGMDFKINYNLTAGQTYYLAIYDLADLKDLDTDIIIELDERD